MGVHDPPRGQGGDEAVSVGGLYELLFLPEVVGDEDIIAMIQH